MECLPLLAPRRAVAVAGSHSLTASSSPSIGSAEAHEPERSPTSTRSQSQPHRTPPSGGLVPSLTWYISSHSRKVVSLDVGFVARVEMSGFVGSARTRVCPLTFAPSLTSDPFSVPSRSNCRCSTRARRMSTFVNTTVAGSHTRKHLQERKQPSPLPSRCLSNFSQVPNGRARVDVSLSVPSPSFFRRTE